MRVEILSIKLATTYDKDKGEYQRIGHRREVEMQILGTSLKEPKFTAQMPDVEANALRVGGIYELMLAPREADPPAGAMDV